MLTVRAARLTATLMSERIPDSDSEVVVIGAAGVAVIGQVSSAEKVDGEKKRDPGPLDFEPHPGPGFDGVRPVLALQIDRHVGIPIDLGIAERVSGAILGVEQGVLMKAADVDAVRIGFPRRCRERPS